MPDITLQVQGLDQLQRQLTALADRLGDQVGPALRAEAEIEMTEAKRRTPVLTGALKGSGHVTGPTWRGRDVTVELKFGGPAAGYAVPVHEMVDVFHKNGEAKFLERPLLESAPHLAARIARRIKLR